MFISIICLIRQEIFIILYGYNVRHVIPFLIYFYHLLAYLYTILTIDYQNIYVAIFNVRAKFIYVHFLEVYVLFLAKINIIFLGGIDSQD